MVNMVKLHPLSDLIICVVNQIVPTSLDCNAKWARTTNKYNGYLYIASTLYYGGSNYDYAKHVYSPATVPQNSGVYTSMHALASTPSLGCGRSAAYGPYTSYVYKTSYYCTTAN